MTASPRMLKLATGLRIAFPRRNWQRFVAVRQTPEQAHSMLPVLASAIYRCVLDRQYRSLDPYLRSRSNIFGVHSRNDALIFRDISVDSLRAILRPHALEYPIELLEIDEGASP